jgi:hypothetical protein
MKKLNASVMTVAVVLALIAFIAPSSAYSIHNGHVDCDEGNWKTTWTFDVTCGGGDPHDISHFTVAWCNEGAIEEVWVGGEELFEKDYRQSFYRDEDHNWDYGDFDGVHGIKIDYGVNKGYTISVTIILNGCYGNPSDVNWAIKADGPTFPIQRGTVEGPVVCTPIPEYSTIAIPIASILGLLFFFNHRKRREK